MCPNALPHVHMRTLPHTPGRASLRRTRSSSASRYTRSKKCPPSANYGGASPTSHLSSGAASLACTWLVGAAMDSTPRAPRRCAACSSTMSTVIPGSRVPRCASRATISASLAGADASTHSAAGRGAETVPLAKLTSRARTGGTRRATGCKRHDPALPPPSPQTARASPSLDGVVLSRASCRASSAFKPSRPRPDLQGLP